MIEISEYIEINGIKQYVLITGNENGPLMLFLHGGPGVSQIGFIRKYQSKLEKKFLVVNWDQRGAGKSNIKKFSRKELTIDNIINDAISLIKILRERFKKTHVYLIGHSFGSLIGIILAQKIPQYIKVYISVGQVVNINEADKVTYKLLSQKIKKENNKKGINILKKIGKPPYVTKDSIRNLDKLIEKYKGDIFKINKLSFILNSISDEYSVESAFYSKIHRIFSYRLENGDQYLYVSQQKQVDETGKGTVNDYKEKSVYIDGLGINVDIYRSAQDNSLKCDIVYDY